MRIHIIGICGTFMGGVALIARELGFTVTGSDENVYPPMSDTLRDFGVEINEGFDAANIAPETDVVVIGNIASRGNVEVEATLNKGFRYQSGPQWLYENALHNRHVLAVSGTHGKTTTSSMLTWVLQEAGFAPGYLIGGVAQGITGSAALGDSNYFVIEADEYDSAFFDKRSKFLHYRPRTLIMNNLEFDHADIFPDLAAIQTQFEYLLRSVPASGTVIYPSSDMALLDVVARGCWSAQQTLGDENGWHAKGVAADGSAFSLWHRDQKLGVVEWSMLGLHNVDNAVAAAVAAHDVGVTADAIIAALKSFQGVKRRMEVRGVVNGVTVYDDFAHHPTAIETTLSGLRAKVGNQRIIAVLQFGSNTMQMGVHRDRLASALSDADHIVVLNPGSEQCDISALMRDMPGRVSVQDSVGDIVNEVVDTAKTDDHILVMSNKGFDGIHQRLLDQLSQ